MFGLGAQELLVLACCGTLPLLAAVVAVVLVLSQKKKSARPRSDDWDDAGDDV